MEAEQQGENVKGPPGGGPLSGWKHGREWVKVQGVERQLRKPCGGLQFTASSWKVSPRTIEMSSWTTLAAVRCVRAEG